MGGPIGPPLPTALAPGPEFNAFARWFIIIIVPYRKKTMTRLVFGVFLFID